jgi:hypothetical protein
MILVTLLGKFPFDVTEYKGHTLFNMDFLSYRLAKSLHNEVEEDVLAKDANKKSDNWYTEIYDPKNPLNRRRRGETKRAEEEKWKKCKPTD